MKENYTHFEKEVIKWLLEDPTKRKKANELFINFFEKNVIAIEIDTKKHSFSIATDKNAFSNPNDSFIPNEKKIIEIIYFLKVLERENYINTLEFTGLPKEFRLYNTEKYGFIPYFLTTDETGNIKHVPQNKYINKLNDEEVEICRFSSNKYLYNEFSYFLNKIIYPTQQLEELQKNRFITPEQKRFKKQYRLTWAGLGVAFIAAMFSIFFGIKSLSKEPIFIKDAIDIPIEILKSTDPPISIESIEAIIAIDTIKEK